MLCLSLWLLGLALADVCFVWCLVAVTSHFLACACPTLLGGDLLGPGGPVAAWAGHFKPNKVLCGLFCLDFMGVGCLGCVGLEVGL